MKIGAGVKIVNPQYVSLGDNVAVSDDVTLIARGEGGIVGAGSVVVKPIPPYSLAVGCPAKVIKNGKGKASRYTGL